MSPTPSPSKPELATEAWRLLFTFFLRTRRQRDRIQRQFKLTLNEVRALGDLDPKKGRPMRSLADAWGTDASNATWVVDRLERQGYAARQAQADDRRVKLVVLTPRGAKTKAALMKAMYEPPASMAAVPAEDLVALAAILRKLLAAFTQAEGEEGWEPTRIP